VLVRAGVVKTWLVRRLARVRGLRYRWHLPADYSWALRPDVCPCDADFCDYLRERDIAKKSIFHFGSGGHHVVGLRNRVDRLENEILAITASPREHAQYVERVVREPSFGKHYKVLFADIYDLAHRSLPEFDLVTLFHLCEFSPMAGQLRRMDDAVVMELFRSKLGAGGRLLFYEGSLGRPGTERIIERAVAEGKISFEEKYRSLLVYRV
jgi:hypothetical protein